MSDLNKTVVALAAQNQDFVDLAIVTRGNLTESWHKGLAVLTGPDGKVIAHKGPAKRLIYPRSAIKPLQTLAMIRAGMKLSGAELAITSASHRGTDAHLDLVRAVLKHGDLSEGDLQCPEGIKFNCSGKHAGFLLASKLNGWDTKDYLNPQSPIQELVIEVLEEFSGEKILHTTVDGCGAPLHSMTTEGIARAIGKLSQTETELVDALVENAWAISNKGVPDAIFLEHGFVAKNGAEGVFVVGTRDGFGICIKIADGNLRAAPLIAIKLMHENNLLSKVQYLEMKKLFQVPSLGGGVPQGEIIAL